MTEPTVRRWETLRLRVLSALVLIPAALAAVWFGSPWTAIVVAIAGLAMAWEWGRLAAIGQARLGVAAVMVAVALTVAAAAADRFELAILVAAAGALGVALMQRHERGWSAGGTLWIAGGCLAFLWLATPLGGGRNTLFCLFAVVWATDIVAYVAGRSIGGPRLAPQLSPNKTWAGFAGGLLGGIGAGIGTALLVGAAPASTAAVSLLLSIAAQGGDLAESWAKRHFAVKDTSALIPGHGGVLDRLDGLLAASIAAALLVLASGGRALHI
jgi:phosphatidate cytidylyltransferase